MVSNGVSECTECPECGGALLQLIDGYDMKQWCWQCGWPIYKNKKLVPDGPRGKRVAHSAPLPGLNGIPE